MAEHGPRATFKPVLRVGIVPIDNALLAANIRQRLGMKPTLYKPLESDFNYQKTQQHKRQDDMPSVGLVQSSGGALVKACRTILLFSVFIFSVQRQF